MYIMGPNGIIVALLAKRLFTPDIASLDPYQYSEPVLQLSKSWPNPFFGYTHFQNLKLLTFSRKVVEIRFVYQNDRNSIQNNFDCCDRKCILASCRSYSPN